MAPRHGRKPFLKRPAVVVLGGLGLLLIAAAATPEGWAFLETQGPRRIVVPDPPAMFTYTLLLIAIAIGVWATWMRARAVREGLVQRRTKNSLFGTILVSALLIALWATSPTLREWLQERLGGGNDRQAEQIEDPNSESPPQRPQREPSAAFGFAITLVLFLLVAAATIAGVWLFRPDESEPPEEEDKRGALMREIQRGIEDLGEIADPRAAVIACYVRMEAVSAASGVVQRASDTPFEHLARLLERHNVAERSARRLTELFERAKFSDKEIDEHTRGQAIAALEDVRAQLGALV